MMELEHGGIFPTILAKIPPEVWELVFEYVKESKDLLNASLSLCFWYDVLHPTKKTWAFIEIFPFLLEHLSKKDVFVCRLVCKKWCFGVDHFLTQNSFHRPVSSDLRTQMMEKKTTQYKTDNRIYPIDNLLRLLDLRYNPVKRLNEIATLSSISPENAVIVGRSAIIAEERKSLRVPVHKNSNIEFLQRFGHQIQFIRINLETLDYFFNVIQYLPNLKKLDFVYLNPCISREQLNQQISNIMSSKSVSELKSILPKSLETLRIYMMRDDQYAIPEFLFSLLAEQVESLLLSAAIPPPIHNIPNRLVDLYIVIRENKHWDFFKCLLKCSLRRLLLIINESHVNLKPIQVVLSNYKNSLRNLELHFTDEVSELKYNSSQYQFFAQERLRLPNLVRLTFKDSIPLSLNFITGIKSLQYLHFFVGRHAKGEMNKALDLVKRKITSGDEELDILKLLFGFYAGTEKQMNWNAVVKYLGTNILSFYGSNIWKIFPKLRVLTVLFMLKVNDTQDFICHKNTKEYEFRRDMYGKLQEDRNKLK